jgi:hypothetical protein
MIGMLNHDAGYNHSMRVCGTLPCRNKLTRARGENAVDFLHGGDIIGCYNAITVGSIDPVRGSQFSILEEKVLCRWM